MSRTAYLYAALPPTKEQEERFLAFLKERYHEEFTLEYRESKAYSGGFRLEVGAEVFDWSLSGRFRQLKDALMQAIGESGDIIPLLRTRLDEWTPKAIAEEIGTVISVGDGIAEVSGLEHAEYGEILLFSAGIRGMVLNLKRESVGCILFGDESAVSEGSAVRRTKRRAGMPVGERFLGRVVGALGDPVDGMGEIMAEGYRPVEAPAPVSDIFRSAPVPSAQTAVAPVSVPEPAPKGSATVRNVPATVLTVLVLIAAGVFSGLLLALGISGSGGSAVSGMDIIGSRLFGVAEKVITIALIAVPVLVALLGIVGALAKSKPLMIIMGVLGILAAVALLLFNLLIALPTTGFEGFADLLTSNFKSNGVWVYIAAGLTVLGAILCFVTAALTKKKPNAQKIM